MSPSASPRVNVVVTPDQHRYLMTLARHQNRSAASLVREMIDAAEPLMKRTVELLELTEEATEITRQTAIGAIRNVLDELADLTGTSDQLGLFSGDLEGIEAGSPAPIGEREDEPASPPSSNTGVRSSGPCAGGRR